MMERMADTPIQALCLLRIFPLVPYNLLNYYIGASYRFTFGQASLAFLCTLPLCFTWVGVGGAIVKFRLVERGEISSDKYLPFIWSGIGCAIALVVVVIGAVSYHVAQKGVEEAELPPAGSIEMSTSKKPKDIAKQESIHLCATDDGTAAAVPAAGGVPPPPPPPMLQHTDLLPGWRELVSEAGDTYFFNDETGESQWEPPLRPGAAAYPPPPPAAPPPQMLAPPAPLGHRSSSEREGFRPSIVAE